MAFTTAQLDAINTLNQNLLIIAGPGSGKTHTLVGRIVHLAQLGTQPENILVATFTEKAAGELITRVSNQLLEIGLKVNLNEMYIGTLHSIFLRILEENREYTRLKRSYRILDDFDQKFFVFRNFKKFDEIQDIDLLIGDFNTPRWERVSNLVKELGRVSEECLESETLKVASEPAVAALGHAYSIYRTILLEENAVDFSTIQTEILFLLENQPAILQKLQNKIHYIMVDEYQDTNTIQERLIFLLASAGQNLCVVGDDDQGLYRFRGATVRNILEFKNNFPLGTCKQITLDTNFRSHPNIIDFYNRWMSLCNWSEGQNKFRYDKEIKPRDDEFPATATVLKLGSEGNLNDYCKEVLAFITQLKASGKLTDYNQIAFLFRSVRNENVIELANFLEENGIPVFSPRSSLFFEREEIKLLVGALVFIFPALFDDLKWSEDAKLKVWDYYLECKTAFANAIRANPEQHKHLLRWCQLRAKEHLTLTKNTNYGFAALLYQLLEFPMFANYLEEADLKGLKTNLRAAYNIALFSKLLNKFEYLFNVTVISPDRMVELLRNLFNTFLRFIIDGGIEEYEDFDEKAPSGCVSFMTIHQSKGLEFPVVVVGSLNLVPRTQLSELDITLQSNYYSKPPFEPLDRIKYFDFYRLFYTAFSRPQNLLVLTTNEKVGQGKSPSKYFEPIYRPLPSWRDAAFDLSKLELESIKPVNVKSEYSFTSHILLYENCPLQYKFYKELEFVEVRTGGVLGGSLLHQTIEDIHKAVLRNEVPSLTNDNITAWFNTNYYLLSKQQRSYLQEGQRLALLKQVLRYRDNNQHQWDRIKEAEVDVSLVKERYVLKGTIDLIRGENDTIELIDFKSGNKPDVNSTDPHNRRILLQYRRQLEIYAHLVEERTGQKVTKMHLYFPKEEDGSPYVTFRSNNESIQASIDTFDKVVEKIESKTYDMSRITKSEKQCGNCDMRFHCNPKHYSI